LDETRFAWRAATGPLGCVRITDALHAAGGLLTVSALGIPLARAPRDAALAKGELQRYLAELPLTPDAIVRNRRLNWEVLGPERVRVSATVGAVAAQVDLTLGADGLVASAFTPGRPRLESVEHPWGGRFSSYRLHEGRQIPFSAEAYWSISGQETAYWRGEMLSWTLSADAGRGPGLDPRHSHDDLFRHGLGLVRNSLSRHDTPNAKADCDPISPDQSPSVDHWRESASFRHWCPSELQTSRAGEKGFSA
jgi:hypothetical protein